MSVIELLSEDLTEGNDGQNAAAPDLDFGWGLIYAKAGTVTMRYTNNNPAPFKHNAAVYRNSTGENLKTSQLVAGTPGGSGPTTSEVTFELEAGTYTIACNVHFSVQQVRLIVLD